MIDEEVERRLNRIEQAVGLPKGITEPPSERVRGSIVGPLVEPAEEEEERLDITELLQKVTEMIDSRFSDLQPNIYEILEEWTSNETILNDARTFITTTGISIKIFEVQSAASGDGIYNCYEQTLDATEWDDTAGDDKLDDKNSTSIEVLNLLENNPEAGYVAHLAANDRMACWQWVDDEGTKRWVGIPIERKGQVRKAYCATAAPAATAINCHLDVDSTGTIVPVNCDIAGGGNLNAALPLLTDGLPIAVWDDAGTWRCTTTFRKADICPLDE